MKILKLLLKIVVVLVVILAVGVLAYIYHAKPVYQGELQLSGIGKNTTVFFDTYGVPHIYADSRKDAMVTLGYLHAQDRLWQMELMRRIAPGRLSEMFGSVALKNDKFFAGLGIEEASAKAIESLDKNSEVYLLSLAYLEGVNQFIENGPTPIEFSLVGVQKEKYTLKDIYNVFGYMSFSFAMGQKTDPLMSELKEKLGDTYISELGIEPTGHTTMIRNTKGPADQYGNISAAVTYIVDQLPVPPFIGSNGWVVAPGKSKNGKVILANDPHIGYSQPTVWYEAHIVTPDYEIYGYHLAGVPFPLLGHNRDYAYGLTMFENDDLDFYKEENNPANALQYKTPDGWKNYDVVKKTIKVKKEKDVELEVKISRHGPVVNDLLDDLNLSTPLAMQWTYTQQPLKTLEAVYEISHAKNINEFQHGVSLIASPGLNVMYGDAKGNIAWWATAKLYTINSGANRSLLLDGASGKDDIKAYLDFSKNPSAVNPKWNYVYSANNQPDSIAGMLYPGYYVPEDRGKRIMQLLESKNDWDRSSISAMMNDVTNPLLLENVKTLIAATAGTSLSADEQKALDALKNWNGTVTVYDVAPTIYYKWINQFLRNTYADELGEANYKRFLASNHMVKKGIAAQIAREQSVWWDNVATKDKKENRSDILVQSFKESVSFLKNKWGDDVAQWTWDKANTLENPHPLGKVAALRRFFDVGPFPMNGSPEMINNMISDFSETGEYTVHAGPSTRRVVDFSDIENSISILPTGQSGNPFSSHYRDQAEMYVHGEFRKMLMNKKEIEETSTKLVLEPAKKN
jgi:penicillin amidase